MTVTVCTIIRISLSIAALLLEVILPNTAMVIILAATIIIGFNLAAREQQIAAAAAREEGLRRGVDRMIQTLVSPVVQRYAEWRGENQDHQPADEQ